MKISTFTPLLTSTFIVALLSNPTHAAPVDVPKIFVDGKPLAESSVKVAGSAAESLIQLDVDWANFEISTRVKMLSPDAEAGIAFRMPQKHEGDANSGYRTGLSLSDENVFLRTGDKIVSRRGMALETEMWYSLTLKVRNNHFVLFAGDKPLAEGDYPAFDVIDNAFNAGNLGLYIKGNAEFGSVKIGDYEQATATVTYTNPVQLNCADPGMLHYEDKYYAYCTYTPDFPEMKRGVRLYTSTNLVNWKDEGFALTNENSWGESRHWAPDIVEHDGTFYMYYAVDERIAVATASSPMGPFKQQKQAPMTPDSIKIDAHVFIDDDGEKYFYYVGFDNGNHIWGAKLNDDMKTVDTSTITHLIAPEAPWETHMANVAEGPVVLKHKDWYYMTYSGSHFESPYYSVGYAVAKHPLGPWKKYEFNPVMQSTPFAHGTAHHSLTVSPDGEEMFIVYHQHYSLNQTEPRKIAIDRIRFVPQKNGPDRLEVWGPTVTPQPMPSSTES
ncbi:family 43 glycosylhydrolase [Alteromonas pelagimontana]|uniref:Family 43 glycosylhydrolase n=1 Tax=Alteromonas pelagimontana TaxID=1858656 RepID=A0A6M4MAF7_9ALTE|nr:glycoside hydrolase family 43 protein [Alteromonas pelagimontana]QJR79959.1 family 43 glycosylhydrolase [Alteromonas pelagimontana]